ncbi:MAG: energy transducer TonB [Bacteroidales bacterium]
MKTRKFKSVILGLAGAALFLSGTAIYAHDHNEKDSDAIAEKTESVVSETPSVSNTPFLILTNAEPKNGWCNFRETLAKNIRYPEYLKDQGVEGTINVRFVVTPEGKIDKISTVANGSLEGNERHASSFKEEAKRAVLASFGEWRPSTLDGKPVVSFEYEVPVTFRIDLLTIR